VKPFEISRVFDASRDQVWKAWTENDRLKQWWGPKGFTVKSPRTTPAPADMHCQLRPMQQMWGKFAYKEVVKEKKLVFISSFSDRRRHTRHPRAKPAARADVDHRLRGRRCSRPSH
jgi:uncharacterized protein YndB with AHSA1/START domain